MTGKKLPLAMAELPEVSLPPINKRGITVGVIAEEYNIGGTRKGRNVVPIYDGRIMDYIAEMAKKRVYHKFDCRILISGPVRTGKSTSAIDLARRIDRNFTQEDVTFRLEDFRKRLAEREPANAALGLFPCVVLDESGVDLYSKDWQLKLVKEMAKVFQIVGKRNLTMIMCLPHRNLLTRDIREQMHIWISTRTDLEGERGFAELREAIENIWQLEVYWKPLCGFCFDPIIDDFWKTYENRKDDFITSFIALAQEKTKEDSPRADTVRIRRQRDVLIKAVSAKVPLDPATVDELTGLTPTRVYAIANEHDPNKKPVTSLRAHVERKK